jgi:hypothetical protein
MKLYVCKEESAWCEESSKQLAAARADLDTTKAQLSTCEQRTSTLQSENDKLKSEHVIIPADVTAKALEIQQAYPSANIVYKGYAIKLKATVVAPEIRVQDFVQVLDSHRKWVESQGLTLQIYLSNNPDVAFGEVMNELMMDIYVQWMGLKSYARDIDLYGVEEQWTPTLDSWYLKKMDCENSTLELMSLFEAAGLIGILKSFYWNVCGLTYSGYGHSTLNVYDFRDDKFRHMESTTTVTNKKSFHDLPEWDAPADELNIQHVWWSFNSDIARGTFVTAAAEEAYNNRQRFKNFIIVPTAA